MFRKKEIWNVIARFQQKAIQIGITAIEWVGKKLIPVHKDGKKLRFRKSEIDEWLNGGRAKTRKELDQAALIKQKLM